MQALTITLRFLCDKDIRYGHLDIAYLLIGVTTSFPRDVVVWLQNCSTAMKRELACAVTAWKGWAVSEKTTPDLHRLCVNWLGPFRAVASEFCLQTHAAYGYREEFFVCWIPVFISAFGRLHAKRSERLFCTPR